MKRSTRRILTYLLLAATSYAVAFAWGNGPGMALFLAGGLAAEVAFWVELIRRAR